MVILIEITLKSVPIGTQKSITVSVTKTDEKALSDISERVLLGHNAASVHWRAKRCF